MKKALITGIGGQDGSYLAEYLLKQGYEVTGTVRSLSATTNLTDDVLKKVSVVYGDMRDPLSLEIAINKAQPDEIYNLAGQTFVPPSWANIQETMDVNVGGLGHVLKIAERCCPNARIYQASSSEMYGNVNGMLHEETVMKPRSPYGVSKLAAHHLARIYREKGLYVCCGILFNHESPRRGKEMVTRKIARAVAQWSVGNRRPLPLGNLEARRDWGFAGDYVKAMHKMLQQDVPDDYVIGLGVSHSVGDFLRCAILSSGITDDCSELIKVDPNFVRPNEVYDLVADTSKARRVLGWRPTMRFESLVATMVMYEQEQLGKKSATVTA